MDSETQKMIAEELGVAHLPDSEQAELIAQFGAIALKASSIAVMEALPDAAREEFLRATESGDQAAVKAVLARALPNSDAIARAAVANEVRAFKEFINQPK